MAPFRNVARFMKVKATMTVRTFNLVVPLAHEATATRITDTAGSVRAWSGAVSPLIGASLRQGDVDSTSRRSMPTTPTMPGISTSTTATRTTTTSRPQAVPAPSADQSERHHAGFSFEELIHGYFDGRYLDELAAVAKEITDTETAWSPATLKVRLSYLRSACNYAKKKHGLGDRNELYEIAMPTVRNQRHYYEGRESMLKIARACGDREARARINADPERRDLYLAKKRAATWAPKRDPLMAWIPTRGAA